jgi:DTW domain-containing protein YfiP
LLYPSDEAELLSETMHFDSCIIIDGTWQEAQKIYNKSPYLQTLPRLKIAGAKKSIYSLRRNQKESGLCTAECAAEVLKVSGHLQQANEIEQQLVGFIEASKLQIS